MNVAEAIETIRQAGGEFLVPEPGRLQASVPSPRPPELEAALATIRENRDEGLAVLTVSERTHEKLPPAESQNRALQEQLQFSAAISALREKYGIPASYILSPALAWVNRPLPAVPPASTEWSVDSVTAAPSEGVLLTNFAKRVTAEVRAELGQV